MQNIFEVEGDLLGYHMGSISKKEAKKFKEAYSDLNKNDRELVLTELNQALQLFQPQEEQLSFQSFKTGGKKKYQDGGRKAAIRKLQKEVKASGTNIKIDGILGPKTMEALSQWSQNEFGYANPFSAIGNILEFDNPHKDALYDIGLKVIEKNKLKNTKSKGNVNIPAAVNTGHRRPTGVGNFGADGEGDAFLRNRNRLDEIMMGRNVGNAPGRPIANRDIVRDVQELGVPGTVVNRAAQYVPQETQNLYQAYRQGVNADLQRLYNSPQYQERGILGRAAEVIQTAPLDAGLGMLSTVAGLFGANRAGRAIDNRGNTSVDYNPLFDHTPHNTSSRFDPLFDERIERRLGPNQGTVELGDNPAMFNPRNISPGSMTSTQIKKDFKDLMDNPDKTTQDYLRKRGFDGTFESYKDIVLQAMNITDNFGGAFQQGGYYQGMTEDQYYNQIKDTEWYKKDLNRRKKLKGTTHKRMLDLGFNRQGKSGPYYVPENRMFPKVDSLELDSLGLMPLGQGRYDYKPQRLPYPPNNFRFEGYFKNGGEFRATPINFYK